MVPFDSSFGTGMREALIEKARAPWTDVWEPLAPSALVNWLMASGSQFCARSLYLQDRSKWTESPCQRNRVTELRPQEKRVQPLSSLLEQPTVYWTLSYQPGRKLSYLYFLTWPYRIPLAVFWGQSLLIFVQEEKSAKMASSRHKAWERVCLILTPILLVIVMTIMIKGNADKR